MPCGTHTIAKAVIHYLKKRYNAFQKEISHSDRKW